MLGYPDQAVRICNEKDAHARQLGHALNLGYALTLGAYAFDYRCEPEKLLERAREADRLAREHGIPIALSSDGSAGRRPRAAAQRHLSESISLLRQGIENWNGLGGHTRVPYLKAALAEALALQGDLDTGLELIDECLEQIERPGWQERLHLAEVLRLKGWMLMRQGRYEEAETSLRASIDWARRAASQVVGAAQLDHARAAAARARAPRRCARGARPDLQLVYRRFRHARSQGGAYAGGVVELRDTYRRDLILATHLPTLRTQHDSCLCGPDPDPRMSRATLSPALQ